MLSARASMDNGQSQIAKSGNHSSSSIRVASIEEIKKHPTKDHHDSESNHISKSHRPSRGKKGAPSAEVEALVSGFEKSATELKSNPKLLRCKNSSHSDI